MNFLNKFFQNFCSLLILLIFNSFCECLQRGGDDRARIIFPDDSGQPNDNPLPVDARPVKCRAKDCHPPNVCYLYLVDEAPVGQCTRSDGTKGVCCEPDVKIIGKDFERKE